MRPSLSRTLRVLMLVGGSLAGLATPVATNTAHAFDLEDYATTYRATRDAYMKAANELKLALGAWNFYSQSGHLLGFALEQQEQYFPPSGFNVAVIKDRTGMDCLDPAGNPNDQLCNTDSTCGGDGKCGARTGPYASIDINNLAATYPRLLEIMDRVARSDSGIAGPPWGDASLDDFQRFFRMERDRAFKLHQSEVFANAEPDLMERPAGHEYEGLIVPEHYDTAEVQFDIVLDQAIYQDVAARTWASLSALHKAAWELKLAEGPYHAARDAYAKAADTYTYSTSCEIDLMQMPAGKWYCGARADGTLRCACSAGEGRCASNDAYVVNEPTPPSSYVTCPADPEANKLCLCVRNDPGANTLGAPCAPNATPARWYR